MGADCKSAGRPAYAGSNPALSTIFFNSDIGLEFVRNLPGFEPGGKAGKTGVFPSGKGYMGWSSPMGAKRGSYPALSTIFRFLEKVSGKRKMPF